MSKLSGIQKKLKMGKKDKSVKTSRINKDKDKKISEKETNFVKKEIGAPFLPEQEKSFFSPGMKTFLFILLPFLLFFMFHFYPFAFNDEQFCFRDLGYSFYPMYLQGQEILQTGDLPYWDSYENLGMPFMGNPVTGIFYPPKLIFFLTFLIPGSYGFFFKWFILIHFPIAYWGIYRLARRWKMSVTASVLSAIVYTFSTPYFFQYCNVIMFIGGTWLPWAVYAGDCVLRNSRRTGSIIGLAIILAVMVFGGDPEAACFAGFFLIGLWLVYWRYGLLAKENPAGIMRKVNSFKPLFRLAGAALLGIFISAAVVLPAGEYTRLSSRGQQSSAYSIWEIPGWLKQRSRLNLDSSDPVYSSKSNVDGDLARGLFCLDYRNDRLLKNRYDASLAPWDFLELLWPNLTGNHFHGFCWSGFWPNDTMWIPTLYMGVIPLLLALSVFMLRGRRRDKFIFSRDTNKIGEYNENKNSDDYNERKNNGGCDKNNDGYDKRKNNNGYDDHKNIKAKNGDLNIPNNESLQKALRLWGSWGVILSLLAALGGFGLGWFFRAFSGADDLVFDNGDPVGGLYWFCNMIIPKFASFRYPAKFTMMTALAFALLVGLGWETLSNHKKRIKVTGVLLLLLTGIAAITLYMTGIEPLANVPRGGPVVEPQVFQRSLISTLFSLTQAGLGLFLFFALWRLWSINRISRDIFALILLIAITVDLVYTNADFIPKRTERDYTTISPVAEVMKKDHQERLTNDRLADDSSLPLRFYMPQNWTPISLLRLDTPDRVARINAWEQSVLVSRHAYHLNIAQFQNIYPTAVSSGVYQVQNGLEELLWNCKDQELRKGIPEVLATLGIGYMICSASDPSPPGFEMLDGSFAENDSYETKVFKARALAQRGWPDNTIVWKNTKSAPHVRISRDRTISKSEDPLRRLVEDFQPSEPGKLPGEYARIFRYEANRLALEVSLKKEGSIILAEQFWPGWRATARKADESGLSFDVPVYKEKSLLRRMDLPAGDYIVEMEFKSRSVRSGLVISAITWIICFGFLIRKRFRRTVPSPIMNDHQ